MRTAPVVLSLLSLIGCATADERSSTKAPAAPQRATETNAELSKRLTAETTASMAAECESGNAKRCTDLAELYALRGPIAEHLGKDLEQANVFAMQGCKGGDGRGCYFLATHPVGEAQGDAFEERKRLKKLACERGDPRGCEDLAPPALDGEAATSYDAHLSQDQIQLVIKGSMEQIKRCYQGKLGDDPELAGTVVVVYRINHAGDVDIVTAGEGTDMPDSAVTACVFEVIRRGKYPAPKRGGQVFVTYPFVFSSEP